MTRYRTAGILAAVGLISTVVAANWAIERYGLVPVTPGWFGPALMAPAGVYFAGLAFGLRDVVHDTLGRAAVFVCIAAGGVLSLTISPAFAVASASAFVLSEIADLFVYERLRQRGWAKAATASNLVGAAVDSALFLWLAFGSLDHIAGQFIGKAWMGALGVALVWGARALRSREPEPVPA